MPYNRYESNGSKLIQLLGLIALILGLMIFNAVMGGQQPAPAATYRHNGPALLNDLSMTPGALSTLPQETLCSPDFHTRAARYVPLSIKFKVCAEYGIPRADCTGATYEIDHLVPLELGGSNDVANLWPQPYAPRVSNRVGAKQKDTVENWLHRQVCTGKLPLAEAQQQIAVDWYQVYLTVPKSKRRGVR